MNEPSTVSRTAAGPSAAISEPLSRPKPGSALFSRLGQGVPAFIILVLLAALAYGGHRTGWTLPKLAWWKSGGSEAKEEWCDEHGVPEAQCVECSPELLPQKKEFGWCKKHGVPECPLCHPEVAQTHDQPQVMPADRERAERALALKKRPENSQDCKSHLRRIQFVSEEAAVKAGVKDEPVREEAVVEFVAANGEITYDQGRLARLSARVPGSVWRVEKNVGDPVRAGELLALIDAPEVGRTKAEFLQALAQLDGKSKTLERMRPAFTQGAVPERQFREAEAAFQEANFRLLGARQALVNLGLPIQTDAMKDLPLEELARRVQFLGLPEEIAKTLDPKTTTASLLPVKAPFDGIVTAREAVAGEMVDPAKVLFVAADVRQMWLTLDVRLEDVNLATLGRSVRFRPDGSEDEVAGAITWISTAVDEKTRTVKVRADLANPEGKLRANTFGSGRIILREESKAILVPSEAVHWDGCCHIVFVRDKDYRKPDAYKIFHVRKVRLGTKDEKHTEILVGVLPGENVASQGSGVLRSELLKGNLGEG